MKQDEAYKAWWHNEGSGILPLPNEDMEEFAHRMTQIAWSNGAFKEREACAKKFVGLTEDEIVEVWHWGGAGIEGAHFKVLYNYFEKKLREKNEN